ncbi:hypothetical protein GJ744_001729 [Endocarpon pusillum]|uniref:Uncharacterized protein n=1 Tax=Endocarpon pusillum TaxID=364733 RepID=A0A8H7ACW0_9EURO|nr:hypothetical protein GJ744_001729 [Endocarpon pusillum]
MVGDIDSFNVGHPGETECSKSGQYTGKVDLPLLPEGIEKVQQSANLVFGPGRLIDPANLARLGQPLPKSTTDLEDIRRFTTKRRLGRPKYQPQLRSI